MNLPAGIESGFEIYLSKSDVRVMIDGIRVDYLNLPEMTRAIFCAEMYASKRVIESLRMMGHSHPDEMELKFVGCRYGAINETPDLVTGITIADAPNCENIGHCLGYGTVCLIPCKLTRKEYQVARFIAIGKLDKEICHLLEITLPTCRTYFVRIREKLGLNNRVEIALWAQKLGIV